MTANARKTPARPRRSTAKDKLEKAAASPTTDSFSFPAAIVWREPGEQAGQFTYGVSVLNGLDELAVPSLLKYGIMLSEKNLGIGD